MRKQILLLSTCLLFSLSVFGQAPKTHTVQNASVILNEFEQSLAREINEARANAASYVKKLEDRKTKMKGKILRLPGRKPFLTNEGVPAIDEAIVALQTKEDLGKLSFSPGLTKVAKSQLGDLVENPALGHSGKDGSDFGKRLAKFGDAGIASENITYWEQKPDHVVLKMLIDDGLKSRAHRANLLDQRFKLFGVACDKGKEPRLICVVVFAGRFDEGKTKKSRLPVARVY